MRQILLAGVIALGVPALGDAQEIGGIYAVQGTNFDGSIYTGIARIDLLSETTCEISWTTGSSTSTGICMRNGNAFAASYTLGDATGLLIYEVFENGSMKGIWTIAGQDGTGTETLRPK